MATEKRLIDANAFIEYYCDDCGQCCDLERYSCQTITDLLDFPTEDAVEVVHGRWILAKPRVKGRNATYRCTACGKLRSSYYNDVFQWEYCPCGAKMDGDGNG